ASGLTGGYDPEQPIIRDFSLDIIGPERGAITGGDGVGKTTLIKLLSGSLTPQARSVQIGGPIALLDQQVAPLDRKHSILENFQRRTAQSSVNDCRALLAAFKFRNDAALQIVGTLSGGEMLRAGLACALGGSVPPMLL